MSSSPVSLSLKITFESTGGGFRQVLNRNYDPPRTHLTQDFDGVTRALSVEFKFDFLAPTHCEETGACIVDETMLDVPDFTRVVMDTLTSRG